MIHVALPLGAAHGWGIAGKSITKELSRLTPVRLITDPFNADTIIDVLEFLQISQLLPEGTTAGGGFNQPLHTDGSVLQAITDVAFNPYRPNMRGMLNVGYTFFEDNLLIKQHIENAKKHYDVVAAGANWCRDVLIDAGLSNAVTVLQGIDPRLFNPHLNEKEFFRDRFVIFTGGKLELRKGQDIVIRAVKALQSKYNDVWLINQWFNPWPASLNTMVSSKLIRYEQKTSDYFQFINHLLTLNGVDLSRVISLGPQPNTIVSRVYKNTDVGLFPNRCEGGTNLVMNEYMACGKPVIASFNTGHKDVLTASNSRRIMTNRPFTYTRDGQEVATWEEPDLDETIAHLEWAYHHRDELKQLGDQAGQDQQKLTWAATAKQFLRLLQS